MRKTHAHIFAAEYLSPGVPLWHLVMAQLWGTWCMQYAVLKAAACASFDAQHIQINGLNITMPVKQLLHSVCTAYC